MEEDDFGDLYGDQLAPKSSAIEPGSLRKTSPSYAFYEEEDEEDDAVTARLADSRNEPDQHHHHNHQQQKQQQRLDNRDEAKIPEVRLFPDQPAERDSDEDDDLLLLGYNFKSGGSTAAVTAAVKPMVPVPDLAEPKRVNIAQNGGMVGIVGVSSPKGFIAPYGLSEVPKQKMGSNFLRDSPDLGDVTNHAITIPGLSTTMNASPFSLGDSGDVVAEDVWEPKTGGGNVVLQKDAPAEGAEDWDSDDSDDDIQIVLNNEYTFSYPAGEKAGYEGEGGSEDEEEDLIIVAPNDEGEAQSLQLPDAQITPGDASVMNTTSEKQVSYGDEKEQPDAGLVATAAASAHPISRPGYGYHNFNSAYKYVRPGAGPLYGAGVVPPGSAPGGRGLPVKGAGGRVEWRGAGRGSFGPQAGSQTSIWSQAGYEYTLPPSMTVFDIDLEAFEEKPWRQPSADVTDFFNFGFDESSWKDYCRQLAQVRLESTMQSKIRVYESGRSEQEYDPDLPPELAAAAGLHEANDRNQHRVTDSEAMTAAMGRRGHTPVIPLGRPIEVEGGLGDRRPSSDLRKQRIRDCDSIILVDAIVEEVPEPETPDEKIKEQIGCEEDKEDQMLEDEDEELEEQDEVEDQPMANNRNTFKARMQQSSWLKEEINGPKNQAAKSGNVVGNSQKVAEGRLRTGFHSERALQSRPSNVKAVATESGKFSGESVSASQRETSSRIHRAYKNPVDGRRDSDRSPIPDAQYAESNQKGLKNDADKNHVGKGKEVHSQETKLLMDDVTHEKHPVDRCADQVLAYDFVQENIPEEIQTDSPAGSLKRHRLASPEGSHTASWDNYDTQKSAKNFLNHKESRDSGDSTRSGREECRKKHKTFSDMNRANSRKDAVEKVDFYHKKQAYMPSRHDLENEIHSQSDNTQENRKRQKPNDNGKDALKDLRHSRDRDEDVYVMCKGRETTGRKGYIEKEVPLHFKEKTGNRVEASRKKDDEERETRVIVSKSKRKEDEEREAVYYKDRGSNRPDVRKREEEERRDRQDVRKRDVEDKRDRIDKGYQHRGKDIDQPRGKEGDAHRAKEVELQRGKEVEPSSWRSLDRRKKEDESRRRDWSEETNDKKEKEKHVSERHDRDADQRERKKDDISWKREKIPEYHKSKTNDGPTRERDSRQTNGEYQELHIRASKDDDRASQGGKGSRRHDEDRSWRGRDDGNISETTKSTEPKSYAKDKRKDLDDYGKDKVRIHELRDRSVSDRDKESFHRSESRDRDSGKHSKASDDLKASDRRMHTDKHRSDGKRGKESEKEMIESNSQVAEYSNTNKKRKATTDKNDMVMKTRNPNASKDELNGSSSGKLGNKVRHYQGSSDDDDQQKGRSKLERWMSHKDLEFEKLSSHDNMKKEEKQRQSSTSRGKQRHDSSKSHDDMNLVDKETEKISSSRFSDEVNGKIAVPNDGRPAKSTVVDTEEKRGERQDRDQHDPAVPELNMAAKLEKRKERFKVSVEDNELYKKLDYEDHQSVDRDESRQERPPRKRRWASG